MGENNYLKILWIVGFVAFAAVSCWATSESLHLLLPTWPLVMCWIVTMGFFIMASFGTKMIVDSFNNDVYINNRWTRLIGGLILLTVFWIVCSLPTNTHTFFYRTVIDDKVNNDISTTNGYLEQILNNTNNKQQAQLKVTQLKNDVDVLLGELEAEIKSEVNPGFGPKAKDIFRKFAKLLGVDKIEPLSYRGVSKQERIQLCDAYRKKMYILTEAKAQNIMTNILSPNPNSLKEVKRDMENLHLVKKYINDEIIDLNNSKDIQDVCDKLTTAYNTVKKNRDFVNFASEADKGVYTADNPVTNVRKLTDVFQVWEDFLSGSYEGYGFLFWIIISALIDIAAFIFFDLAFKKTEY